MNGHLENFDEKIFTNFIMLMLTASVEVERLIGKNSAGIYNDNALC